MVLPYTKKEFNDVKLLDVGSMYPSIIILLNALDEHTDTYDGIRKERLAIKHVDKLKSDALKLVLNSVYGNLKNQYSILYNPLASRSVCIYGQMALFDLCTMLHNAGYQIINANTDGVAFNGDGDQWKEIQKEWEQRWRLSLELDEFKWWYQKDVNNYISIGIDDHVKVKGGEIKKYTFDPGKYVHGFFSNNDCRIVHIVLVEYILSYYRGKRINIIKEVMKHLDDPILFQYVLKAGGTYKGVVNSEGEYQQKVNRVFAVKPDVPHTKLYKERMDGGKVLFPDAPENMWVCNEDLSDIEGFKSKVDVSHYVNIIRKKLSGWGFEV